MTEQMIAEQGEDPIDGVADDQQSAEDALAASQEEAKKYGWRPHEDFKLAPEGWVDAARFMELPATQVKVQRDEMRTLRDELANQKTEFDRSHADMQKKALEAVRTASNVAESHYAEKLEGIKAEKLAAVETADTDAYNRAQKREDDIQEHRSKTAAEPADNSRASEITAALADKVWKDDPYLIQQANAMVAAYPDVQTRSVADQAKFADEKLRDMFPHKFEKPAPAKQQRSRVEGGGLAGLGGGGQGFDSLGPEYQAAGRQFVTDGIFKDVEEYAKAVREGGA